MLRLLTDAVHRRAAAYNCSTLAASGTVVCYGARMIRQPVRAATLSCRQSSNRSFTERNLRYPQPLQRSFNSLGAPMSVVTPVNALIAANVAAFAFWHMYAWDHPWWRRWYNRHMFLSISRVRESWAPFLGHMFMHADGFHLLSNMVALKSFGDTLTYVLGTKRFLALYLGAGLVGAATQLQYHRLVPSSNIPAAAYVKPDAVAVGASAAIAGVVMMSCALFPSGTVYLLVFPVPNLVFMSLFLGWSVYGAYTGSQHSWAHAAHLGGAVTGLAAFGLMRFGRLPRLR